MLAAMKTLPVVLATMMALTQAWAAKDVDLSEFDGNYRGKGNVVSSGMPFPLTADVKFDVSKNGSTAKVVLSGVVTVTPGNALPWGTTLKLKKKGKMTTSSLIGFDSGGIFPATGRYKLPKSSKLETTAQGVVPGNISVIQEATMTVKPKGRKKELKVQMTVIINGAPGITYTMKVTGK